MNAGSVAGDGQRSRRSKDFQRVYKACESCRKKKTRCVLDPRGNRDGGPCGRCKREFRECVFSVERSARKERSSKDDWSTQSQSNESEDVSTYPASMMIDDTSGSIIDSSQQHTSSTNHLPYHQGDMPDRPHHPQRRSTFTSNHTVAVRDGLADTVMRTLVSNGNEALDLLYCAAEQRSAESPPQARAPSISQSSQRQQQQQQQQPPPAPEFSDPPVTISPAVTNPPMYPLVGTDVRRVWDSFRFVKMGWFTSDEAVLYMDMFFRNHANISPVCHGWDPSHDKHYALITQEPLLTCTILMISARYHVLPGAGGLSRGIIIHQRLWEHCQHLIMRIIFGQEKKSKAKTRTIGALEALLLINEWHPKAIHFPPAADGWDSDLLLSVQDIRDDPYGNQADVTDGPEARWLADIVEPARMSDRMSWMLLGCAQALAHELDLYDVNKQGESTSSGPDSPRRRRIAKLLFIFIEQLSSRLGCASLVPSTFGRTLRDQSGDMPESAFLSGWIELTNLLRTISDVLFPSTSAVRQLLVSGRYINIIKHFQEQLLSWKNTHLKEDKLSSGSFQELSIEYNNLRIFMNSLGIQAVVDRVLQEGTTTSTEQTSILQTSLTATDYEFIQEVTDGCCQILQSINHLADDDTLRFRPVRIFLRVIAASMFLLKALSLGSHAANLQASLAILERTIGALHASSFDDMHLASRYASLLDRHVARFRERLVPSSVPRGIGPCLDWGSSSAWEGGGLDLSQVGGASSDFQPNSSEDWMSLPFDASLAPFGFSGDTFEMTEFDDKAWEFLRNWPNTT